MITRNSSRSSWDEFLERLEGLYNLWALCGPAAGLALIHRFRVELTHITPI